MAVFKTRCKVRFGDIDQAGIVYYPRFLHYFHTALEEFFSHELGIDYPTVVLRHRLGMPTVHLETNFKKPLRYGDVFEVAVHVRHIGQTSIEFGYTAYIEDTDIIALEGHNVTVCIEMQSFEKKKVPSWLREKLEEYQQKQEKEKDDLA